MHSIWFILLIIWVPMASAEIYRWVDEEGTVHFTDEEVPQGETIKLPPVQIYDSSKSPKLTPGKNTRETEHKAPPLPNLSISKPGNDQVLFANDGTVNVSVKTDYSLLGKTSFTVRILLNGSPSGTVNSAGQLALKEVNRGSHTLTAELLSPGGAVLKQSDPILFHLRRHSILHPTPP